MLHTGHVVHGDVPDPAVRLDGVVSADGSQALYRFTQLTSSANYPPQPLALPGLDPSADYRIRPLDVCRDLDRIGNGQSPLAWWRPQGAVLPGAALGAQGIRPPVIHPAEAVIFEASRI